MNKSLSGAALAALTCFCAPSAAQTQETPAPPPAATEQPAQPPLQADPIGPSAPEPAKQARPATVDDGVEVGIGGVIHLDGNWLNEDQDATFGSSTSSGGNGLFVRRAILRVGGRAGGWRLRFEPDFASDPDTGETDTSFEDLYAAHRLGPGELKIGQRRPFRGMEDLTSSNDILLMERPFASSAGVFNGGQHREFALGAFYQGHEDHMTYGAGVYSLRAADTPGTEGAGASLRMTLTPWVGAGRTVHLGASVSYEDPANDQSATPATTPMNVGTTVSYAGSRGPVAVLGLTSGAEPATTFGVEAAAALGPVFAQAEFMAQHLEQSAGRREQVVLAYYLQGSLFLTGEPRPYNAREGVFRSPTPSRPIGAWELTARYDEAGNRHAAQISGGCGGSALARRCVARALTLGTNYYFRPGVRLMLNYVLGEADRGRAGTDSPQAVTARFQFAF